MRCIAVALGPWFLVVGRDGAPFARWYGSASTWPAPVGYA